MAMLTEFREFAVKGNVIDLAVGVIIGAAFGKIVESLVGDLIMPVVGAIFGKLDFSNLFLVLGQVPSGTPTTLDALKKAGRAGVRLRQLHHRRRQLRAAGLHHFPDGQAVQPDAGARARRRPRPRAPPEDVVLLREIRDSLRRPLGCARSTARATRIASSRLDGSARPVPAMSKAVP